LMIAGRLHWKERVRTGTSPTKFSKNHLAAFQFDNGLLTLTEAGTQRRASLHLVKGEENLRALDRGGLDLFQQPDRKRGQRNAGLGKFIELDAFARVLTSENHTLKRSLTDPRLFSGIGNAYSDEILHRARLSPILLTTKLTQNEITRLHEATHTVLSEWIDRLRAETGQGFPERVTAFRKDMAVHGRYREPCPVCATPIQRIVYSQNEANYCPTCQTGGKLLADRSLSMLLKKDWPRTADELEYRMLTQSRGGNP